LTCNNAKGCSFNGGNPGPTGVVWAGLGLDGAYWASYCDISSDERIKDNIAPTTVDALATLNAIQVSQFDIKPDCAAWFATVGEQDVDKRVEAMQEAAAPHVAIGLVAQHVREHIPECINVTDQSNQSEHSPLPSDMMTMTQENFAPYFLRAIQQLSDRLMALESATKASPQSRGR